MQVHTSELSAEVHDTGTDIKIQFIQEELKEWRRGEKSVTLADITVLTK